MDRNNALTDPSKIVMKFENVYFINGTAYAGKSTMVKLLAEKYDGIACEENYQDRLLENLDTKEFPNLTYTRDLQDWGEFVRRTPDEYEEKDNPNYPDEGYEAFILRMIDAKKLKIEKVLDLK